MDGEGKKQVTVTTLSIRPNKLRKLPKLLKKTIFRLALLVVAVQYKALIFV